MPLVYRSFIGRTGDGFPHVVFAGVSDFDTYIWQVKVLRRRDARGDFSARQTREAYRRNRIVTWSWSLAKFSWNGNAYGRSADVNHRPLHYLENSKLRANSSRRVWSVVWSKRTGRYMGLMVPWLWRSRLAFSSKISYYCTSFSSQRWVEIWWSWRNVHRQECVFSRTSVHLACSFVGTLPELKKKKEEQFVYGVCNGHCLSSNVSGLDILFCNFHRLCMINEPGHVFSNLLQFTDHS